MSESFLIFIGAMLNLEQALLWLVLAQSATAISVLTLALVVERFRRDESRRG